MNDPLPVRMLLVSSDLMAASRLAGIARGTGAEVETLANPAGTPRGTAFDVVLLDLQSLAGDIAAHVARSRELGGATIQVVAFGPHVWKERLEAAVAAGADLAVSRGTVMDDLAGLLARVASR
jgi:DNA-binding NarL/FixJ family response regulator